MKDFLNNQIVNSFCWIPFLLVFGAGIYFNLSYEPNIIIAIGLLVLSAIFGFYKKSPILIKVLCVLIFGFAYSCIFTNIKQTPQLASRFFQGQVSAVVEHIDYANQKSRLYLSFPASEFNPSEDKTATVRVSYKGDISNLRIGDVISARIGLFRPAGAYAPETFNYARWAYFNNLSATGYLESFDIVSHNNASLIDSLRNNLHNKANSFLADSLVLGYKNAVPENDKEIWNTTGIGHVWSISGFHISLVGGWLILFFYMIFRSIPYLVKRIPARIPAIICGWLGLLFYLFLSGLDVATIRAFLMTTLVFVAFLVGRKAFSLRNICLVFCFLFFINPHYVMQPGFQLSFSAVFGLIWLWTVVKPVLPKNKIIKIIYSAVLTSLVAGLFTAPFVIAHFYSFPIYTLLGNLILIPVFSFIIMPLVILGLLAVALFNWNHPLQLSHLIYNKTLIVAQNISEMPFASLDFPFIPNIALVFIIFGFVCLILVKPLTIKFINLYLCLAGCLIGISFVIFQPKPLFMATNNHELVAFSENGKLVFNKSRAAAHYFAFDTWKRLNFEPVATPNKRKKHNKGVYSYNTDNFNLVYIQKFVPLMNNIKELCSDDNLDYIVSYFDIKSPNCKPKILKGGLIIYDNGHIKHVPDERPWHSSH